MNEATIGKVVFGEGRPAFVFTPSKRNIRINLSVSIPPDCPEEDVVDAVRSFVVQLAEQLQKYKADRV